MAWVSRKMAECFVAHGIIKEVDVNVYAYSFELLIATVINLTAVVVLSVISKTVIETGLYLLGFIPLRNLSGGYHAKNHLRCFLLLILTYAVFVMLIYYLPIDMMQMTTIVIMLLSIGLVLMFAPSDVKNKRLSKDEIARSRKMARIGIACYAALASLLLIVFQKDVRIALSLAMGVFSVALFLPINYYKQKWVLSRSDCFSPPE